MLMEYGGNSSEIDCATPDEIDSVVLSPLVTAATIVSCSLSIAGSLLILVTFLLWKDVRKSSARWILAWIAVADLFGASLYLAAGVIDAHKHWERTHNRFDTNNGTDVFCVIQAFATTYFPVVSFFWTAYLAVYFAVNLVLRKHTWGFALQLVFHLSAWCIPLIILAFTAAYGYLGDGRGSGTGGWCWINDSIINHTTLEAHKASVKKYFLLELFTGKLWEILSYIVVVVCYLLIVIVNRCELNRYSQLLHHEKNSSRYPIGIEQGVDPSDSLYKKQKVTEALARVDLKLIFIPIVFIFLRLWGTVRFFISMHPSCHEFTNVTDMTGLCINNSTCFGYLYSHYLVGLQAFCDPFQGFGNCVLFIFCSKVIVLRLLRPCLVCSCPVLKYLRNCRRALRSQKEETQSLVVNGKETSMNGSDSGSKPQTPQLIRVLYNPKLSSSHSEWNSDCNRTSDYATDEDVPTNPSRHISYGTMDQTLSNGARSF